MELTSLKHYPTFCTQGLVKLSVKNMLLDKTRVYILIYYILREEKFIL